MHRISDLSFKVAIFLGWGVIPHAGQAVTFEVEMSFPRLTPQDLTINQGDRVVWISRGPGLDTRSYTGEWKSSVLASGETFSYTFQKPGVYVYGSHDVLETSTVNNGVTGGTITVLAWTNSPPAVMINTPIEGFYFTREMPIPILASLYIPEEDASRVEFFAGTTLIGEVTNAPYRLEWTNAVEGSYALTARVTERQGLQVVSQPVNITVELVPNQRGHLWDIRQVTNGVFVMHFNKGTGFQTCIRASDDLKIWHDYAPVSLPTPGTFVDEAASNKVARFYWIEQCFGR